MPHIIAKFPKYLIQTFVRQFPDKNGLSSNLAIMNPLPPASNMVEFGLIKEKNLKEGKRRQIICFYIFIIKR